MIDADKVVAIDVHVHAEISRTGQNGLPAEFRKAAAKYFGSDALPTAEHVAAYSASGRSHPTAGSRTSRACRSRTKFGR